MVALERAALLPAGATTSRIRRSRSTDDPLDRAVHARRGRGARRARPLRTTSAPSSTTCSTSTRSSSCAPAYAPNMVTGLGAPRRAAGRRRRQPADVPRRHARHRGVAQRRPGSCSGATASTSRSSRSSTRRGFDPGPRPRVARDDPSRRRAGARVRRGDGARGCASLLRKAYGGAYIVMDSQEPRQRLVHRVADRRGRGDGRAAGAVADPVPPRSSPRSRTTPSALTEQRALEAEYAAALRQSVHRGRARLRRRRHRRHRHPARRSPTRSMRLGDQARAANRDRRHSNTPL